MKLQFVAAFYIIFLDKKKVHKAEPEAFLKCEYLQEKVGCNSPVEALGEIRKRKDNWRG